MQYSRFWENVTIGDLAFINSEPGSIRNPTIYDGTHCERILSPVSWKGSNGVLEGCSFYNSCAVNGGAVTWMGDNGTIDNCFANNTARVLVVHYTLVVQTTLFPIAV